MLKSYNSIFLRPFAGNPDRWDGPQPGFSTEVISEGLGHKDIKTTRIYLESIENKVLDDMNDRVVGREDNNQQYIADKS